MKTVGSLYIIVFLVGFIGWCMNIATIVSTVDHPLTGLFVVRCIGVVCAPLGAVLGFF